MVSDINTLRSHPDKLLLKHIQGVMENTKKLTNSKIAELVALFHDLGKINPNFQDKLDSNKIVNGYSNHSYLSAYVFFCAFGSSNQNKKVLSEFLGIDAFNQNNLIAFIVLIAKHHGNLPDFSPTDNTGTGASILSKDENSALYQFINQEKNLPVYEFINHFISIDDFRQFLTLPKIQQGYSDKLVFKQENIKSALEFFLDNQFAFASVIHADKVDAGNIEKIIDNQQHAIHMFSENFSFQLDSYLVKLNQDSELNKLRTSIRNHAVENIRAGLMGNENVYELTAPTGSGKTLMMLSLASEIIKAKGTKRIIYGLPFLSITEQVEAEVLKIFEGNGEFIQRIDSKSENHQFEKIQAELDNNPTEENILEANILEFQVNTFAYPFVITTFVRFFETMLSNRNSELLKLPNFSNCIFLLDEIQALPPRLYGFFVAYIKKFCAKFNSFAIISTATQPNFELPINNVDVKNFFSDYERPIPLLPLSYFENDLFNRYEIEFEKEPIDMETLKDSILAENKSTLVILNTIDDTKELYKKLQDDFEKEELILLNTHFTPQHRKLKIYLAKRRLRQHKRIVVVSTQLIEAGVDIDFPVLYRDFATIASIVQSAGRCNRNGKLDSFGTVKLFKLKNKGKIRCDIIYNGKDKEILQFTKESFTNKKYQERELLAVQKEFFNRIQSELNFAQHSQNGLKPDFDFIKDITECQFAKIGKFQLIDKQLFGEEMQFFVSRNQSDKKFADLLTLQDELIDLIKNTSDYKIIRRKKKSIAMHLKKMSRQIVQVRLKPNHIQPLQSSEKSYFNLYKISSESYCFHTGVDLKGSEFIL
jgi:CRISPR-associated endonuclease/helicase Cas3